MLFDVFICHASEDKDILVRPLAERLAAARLEVWYDEFSLKVGDGLRRSIDRGLTKSRYGIVVLSPAFFRKAWPQWELDGLVQRQNRAGGTLILPIWHDVDFDDVFAFSPSLSDKYAADTRDGIDEVIEDLLAVIRPEGSTLIVARDRLIDYGYEPPVVTDDWWLDVVEASAIMGPEYRWEFHLPSEGDNPKERGERVAWAAMQLLWKADIEDARLCQMTPPDELLSFIDAHSGMAELCSANLFWLIAFAPQLTIPGFGGRFEDGIEAMYCESLAKREQYITSGFGQRSSQEIEYGVNASAEELALRHPYLSYERPSSLACGFVQGFGHGLGPSTRLYPHIDYAVWLLSSSSEWLPTLVRATLTQGMIEWPVWAWYPNDSSSREFDIPIGDCTGALADAMYKAKEQRGRKLPITPSLERDMITRFQWTKSALGLPETPAELTRRFIDAGFITGFLKDRRRRSVKSE
jgi:TIR domain